MLSFLKKGLSRKRRLAAGLFADRQPPEGMRLIAHRGFIRSAPENTEASFTAAGESEEIFGIESDVHRTKDGAFVMIHDDNTRRVADNNLFIRRSGLAELRALTLHMPDGTQNDAWRIPTLEEYLSVCKKYQKAAFIELKYGLSKEDIRALNAAVRAAGYAEHTAYISFTLSYLLTLRALSPDTPLLLLTVEAEENMLNLLREHRIGIDLLWESYTPDAARRIRERGLPTGVFTVNDMANARRLADRGATYITTDDLG